MGAAIRRSAINSRAYASVPGSAARVLNQLRRGHRAWPMFELKSGAALAAPAALVIIKSNSQVIDLGVIFH